MAPRGTTLLSLMSSTAYPPLPPLEDLEQLQQTLSAQSAALSARLAAIPDEPRKKNDKKRDRDAREEEDRERAALAANERAGIALEAVERRRFDSDVKVKRERVSPAPSNASSASFRPNSSQSTYGSMLNKKKKPKRVPDSDDEGTTSHPTPPHSASTSGLKLKLPPGGHQKSRPPSQVDPSPTPSSATATAGGAGSIDWSVPPQPQRPLVPPRPGLQPPLPAGPKRQADVDEDYSDKKAPSQISVQTFWQNIEPYIRDVREDDLAMLNFKADTPDSYVIPARGKHYTEMWDEEDGSPIGTTQRFPVPSMRQGNGSLPPLQHFVASEVRDANLSEENRGLGPMTERMVAAVIGGDDMALAAKAEAAGKPEPEDDGRDAARVDVVDLEDRVKKELRSVMLLGEHEEFDPTTRDDDEVTSALRQCQRLLSKQTALNDARKARLADIARHRLAFTEYTSVLDDLEKQIEASWAKRVKKHGSGGKKTIQNGVVSGNGRPAVPDSLKQKLAIRQKWIDSVGRTMKERPTGEVLGLPTSSIYAGIEDENKEAEGQPVDDKKEDKTAGV